MAKPKSKIKYSTQQYLDISEIKDDIVVLRDGTMRAVLMISSINFALKSEEEQNAIIAAYVSFLNNIEFPMQIVIQSRELNIEKYLNNLSERFREQTNELLKIQTSEYIAYIKELVSMGKIMSKRFYIVIPYDPLSDKQKGFFSKLMDAFRPITLIKMKDEKFLKRKGALIRRVENIITGLASVGLSCAQLDTQGLIELYYNTYNPALSLNQKLTDVNELKIAE
jgi:hypothetical protein